MKRQKEGTSKPRGEYCGSVVAVIALTLFLWGCQDQASLLTSIKGEGGMPAVVQSAEAREILEKHIEAVGGLRALKRIHSKKTVGKTIFHYKKINNTKIFAQTITYQQRPDKYYSITKGVKPWGAFSIGSSSTSRKLRGKVLIEAGTDGKLVWMDAQQSMFFKKRRLRQGADRIDHLIRYGFDILQYETPYIGLELLGMADVKGRACYKLAITPLKGTPHYYFINKESLLIDKIVYNTWSKQTIKEEEIIFNDYREVEGIQLAHKLNLYQSGHLVQTYVVESFETNIAILADHFAIPLPIRSLASSQTDTDEFNYSPLTQQPLVTISSRPKGRSRVVRTYYTLASGELTLHEKYTKVGNVWHGSYRSYFPNTQLKIEESYIMDTIHGPSIHYDDSGNVIREENYHLGRLDGSQSFYCADGTLKIKTGYHMGSKHGRAEIYHQCSGILAGLSFYENGLLEGEKTAYYADGKIKERTTYQKDKPHGMSLMYHANGQLAAEKRYENGIREGGWKYYYESGNLKAEENYKNDEFHGIVKSHYPNGVSRQETSYRNGLQHGGYRYYYKNGKLKDQARYKAGKLSGIKKRYAWSGYLWLEESYKNDLLDGPTRRFNAKGEIINEVYYKNGQSMVRPKGR